MIGFYVSYVPMWLKIKFKTHRHIEHIGCNSFPCKTFPREGTLMQTFSRKDFLSSGMPRSVILFRLLKSFFLLSFLCIAHSAMPQKEYPLISIDEIKTCKSDTFRIKAKVIDRYRCPPCPPGAICKPCIGNHLTVSDGTGPPKQQLIVFTKSPNEFEKDKMYLFVLRLSNKLHPDSGTNLVSSELSTR